LSIASKFFYAENIRGARISWKVCAGINGYRQSAMNLDRMHLVEAFCFMTVFKFLFSPEYTYEKRFSEKMGEINQSISKAAAEKKTINLEVIREDMYAHMVGDKSLELALISEYEKKKEILNFKIVD
jgi:hypothetical protein